MENAVDALKMAFAVLVFIGALSLAMYSFTMVRQTSDAITSETDQRQYYQQLSLDEVGDNSGMSQSALASSSRIVGVETVIPTLYRYAQEEITILFYRGTGFDETTGEFENIDPMPVYYTETDDAYLQNSLLTIKTNAGDKTRAICGFDSTDESARREPWMASTESNMRFIQAFIYGTETEEYQTSHPARSNENTFERRTENGMTSYYYTIDFGNSASDLKGLLNQTTGNKLEFVERSGEYSGDNVEYNTETGRDEFTDSTITDSYIELDNDEIVIRRNQTNKRVIQYIYIASRK